MVATSKIILPYEPGYVGNKEADKRRKETKERMRSANAICRTATAAVNRAGAVRAISIGGFVTVGVSKSARTAQASA